MKEVWEGMSKKLKRIKVASFLLLIVLTIVPVYTVVNAATPSNKFNFDLGGLEKYTSDNYKLDDSSFYYEIYWSNVVTDNVPLSAYHLQVNLQKRNALIFWVSQSNVNFVGPISGSKISHDFGTDLADSTIRYKLYNYGAYLQQGTVSLYN